MHTFPRCRSRSDSEFCSWFRTRQLPRGKTVDVGPVDYLSRRSVGWTLSAAAILFVLYWSWNFWFIQQPEKSLSIQKSGLPFIVSSDHILFEIGSGSFVSLIPVKPLNESAEIQLVFDDPDILEIPINSFTIEAHTTPRNYFIPLLSKDVAGHCVLSFKTNSKSHALRNLFQVRIHVQVVHHTSFGFLSICIGWIYFCFWSTCYYPQIYHNFRRRSVVGFSFDYLALNITGHLCYLTFNLCMYYNNAVQRQFTKIHPKGQLPVKLNDVLFSVHAISMNMVLLSQCLMYERADQKVTMPMRTLVGGLWITIIASLGAAITEKLSWLQFLYYLTYIKVGTTPIKYTPQVYLNYVRKSTDGWSIQGVMLDVGGGIFSFLQMVIDAVNNDDWDGTLGNPGKLGLSCIAMIYDSIFMTQHFLCYSSNRRRKLTDPTEDQEGFQERLHLLKKTFTQKPALKSKGLYMPHIEDI